MADTSNDIFLLLKYELYYPKIKKEKDKSDILTAVCALLFVRYQIFLYADVVKTMK